MLFKRIIRPASYWILYWIMRFGIGPGLFLTRYRRVTMGAYVIVAPLNKMPLILQGFVYLQTIDMEMYQRLVKNRICLCYIQKLPLSSKQQKPLQEIYTITDNYLKWGNEGIAVCLVQTVLWHEFRTRLSKDSKGHLAASFILKQQLYEWIKGHSFSPELVKQYQKALEDDAPSKKSNAPRPAP